MNAYNATRYTKTLKHAIRISWILIAVVFVVELTFDMLQGFLGGGVLFSILLAIYILVLGIGILVIAILFLIYGRRMTRRLKTFSNIKSTNKRAMKKGSFF